MGFRQFWCFLVTVWQLLTQSASKSTEHPSKWELWPKNHRFGHICHSPWIHSMPQGDQFWWFFGQRYHLKGWSIDLEALWAKSYQKVTKNHQNCQNPIFRGPDFCLSISRRNQKPLFGTLAYLVELLNTFPVMGQTFFETWGQTLFLRF